MQKRHTITNDTASRLVVFTEPEGQDFWLLPDESLEVVADAALPDDEFRLVRLPDGYQVWPAHKMGYISAWVGDRQLPCGHQRPAVEPLRSVRSISRLRQVAWSMQTKSLDCRSDTLTMCARDPRCVSER